MANETVRIPRMAKKKPGKAGESQGRSPSYTLFTRIPPELGAALEAYVKSLKPRPSITAAVETFLEECLTARGFWPPSEVAQEGE